MNEIVTVAGFPITPDTFLRRRGEHDGLHYEVTNSTRSTYDFCGSEAIKRDSGGTWCYYVTILEASLSPELFAEFWLEPTAHEHKSGFPRISYDYYGARFSSVDWHGGVTYYEKFGGLDGAQRYVKIGCDFAHSWDEGCEFDFTRVEQEAIATVKQLQTVYAFRRRCPYFGTYHDAVDMIPHPKSGALYSEAGIAAMNKEAA